MTDAVAVVELVLSADGSLAEKMQAIDSLHDHLLEAVDLLLRYVGLDVEVPLRLAAMRALSRVDVGRVPNRPALFDTVSTVLRTDPERPMRRLAVDILAAAAPEFEALLCEALRVELDETVQLRCIEALRRSNRPATLEALTRFGPTATEAVRAQLISALTGTEAVASFLMPWDARATRQQVLDMLFNLPRIGAATVDVLLRYLQWEPDTDLQRRILEGLLELGEPSPSVLAACWHLAHREPAVLASLSHRLSQVADTVVASFRTFESAAARLEILALADQAGLNSILLAALSDRHPTVRLQAARRAARRVPEDAARWQTALAAALAQESVVSVRYAQVQGLLVTGAYPPAVEAIVLQTLLNEPDPGVGQALAQAAMYVAVTADTRDEVLAVWCHLLREPFISGAVRGAITDRLSTFAYQEAPGLADCLRLLLLRCTEVDGLERLYTRYAQHVAEPDCSLLLTLFYRFADHYPREPLHQWLSTLHERAPQQAEVRQQIPYLARLTGATWILDAADVDTRQADLADTIMEAVRSERVDSAYRLLQQGYVERTLRKRDVRRLFFELLQYYDSFPLVDELLKIMQAVQLFDADVVASCLHMLTHHGEVGVSYAMQSYLKVVAPLDIGYRERVLAAFTPDAYQAWCRASADPTDTMFVPQSWADSGHWRTPYPNWPLADLFFALEPWDVVADLLAQPARGPDLQSLNYRLLHELYRKNHITVPLMRAVGRVLQASGDGTALQDRTLFVVCHFWPRLVGALEAHHVPGDLADVATAAMALLIGRWQARQAVDPDPVPPLLEGARIERLPGDALWGRYRAWLMPKPSAWKPHREVPPHTFEPVSQAADLVQAIVGTETEQPDWVPLLKTASEHHRAAFTRALNDLPGARQRALLERLA